eukprot:8232033-Pyramimonas_sp.AAC.1
MEVDAGGAGREGPQAMAKLEAAIKALDGVEDDADIAALRTATQEQFKALRAKRLVDKPPTSCSST